MLYRTFISLSLIFILAFQGFSEDYYWVGGQGIWSDLNSWRTISGSIPNEVPDATDNVIFNENSFLNTNDTVFILTQNPVCKNMTWENIQDTVVISGGSNLTNFNIYASVTFCPFVVNEYQGKITFMSQEQGNTITCSDTRFAGDIWFDGNGEWILQDTLLVIDTNNWESIVIEGIDPVAKDPFIIHNNGSFNTNEQVVIGRGFSTPGDLDRELIIENSHFYNFGGWQLSGQSLTFNSTNSLIIMAGEMQNIYADIIYYHDIHFMPTEGAIKNIGIRTQIRKVHFFGSGKIEGSMTEGNIGSFTIDTLLMEGAFDPESGAPIPCEITGFYNYIHYTQINQVMGYVYQKESNFHRIDYNGDYDSYFEGFDNVLDSAHFNAAKGKFVGTNTVNNLLYYNTHGILAAYTPGFNEVNHAVFRADGELGGNNNINILTLNSGYWYQIQADSIVIPGSYYTDAFTQTINEIEVEGGCNTGLSLFTSTQKTIHARIDYKGGAYPTEYLSVRDIKNVGSTITVEHGIDIANNIGFNFINPLESRPLYWVGDSGDWSDNSHWATSSGGVGDQCPPTIIDDVFFDENSFTADDQIVNCDVKYACMNDITWEGITGLPTLSGSDTNNLRIWGSVKFSVDMQYKHWGRVFFESEDDTSWEKIDLANTFVAGEDAFPAWHLFNQTYFYGAGGKWELMSKMYNMSDTLFLEMGEVKMTDDTVGVYNFNSMDTLTKGLYLYGKTLFEVHQYNGDAWVLNAFGIDKPENPNLTFDAGKSTIRALGDISPPPGAPPGVCHVRTYAGEVTYNNIEFGDTIISGIKSMLKSESLCHYNLVDYYVKYGDAVGNGTIDTLTYKQLLLSDGTLISAEGCKIRNVYEINFVMAESPDDTLIGNHTIDTVFFFENGGALYGYHEIGYLQADKYASILFHNIIDTAVFYGNASILGSNTFSKLVLSPNKRYFFAHDSTQIINDDFIVNGNCDAPIRFQSDSIGTSAKILYKAQNPTFTDFTANYASLRDMTMVDFNGYEYTAVNSIDLGNNENWTFIETDDDVYYWVGGQGKWGDWNHWSFESGGAAIAGMCTPKEINTIVFDDNSFNTESDTVFLNVLNAYCKNIYWKQSDNYNPVFIGPDTSVLYVYGSFHLSENMDYQYYGDIYFDQFNEPGDIADTITTRGQIILSDFYFQGIDDLVYLGDNLTMFVDAGDKIFNNVFLEYGGLVLNGNHLNCGKVFSIIKNERLLNIENSTVTVKYEGSSASDKRAWSIDGENLEFFAYNSTIYDSAYQGGIVTLDGDYIEYYNIVLDKFGDSLANFNNIVEYNTVYMNGGSGKLYGNYVADSIFMRGTNSEMINYSSTNVVILDSSFCWIRGTHDINRAFINKFGFINGDNDFEYCVFNAGGMFYEEHVFDTLVLYPGQGDFENQGNWFFFEAGKTQTITDSLSIRGNQCSNITITSLSAPNLAYLKMEDVNIFGEDNLDVSCDYLNINSVGAESEMLDFYAGKNSLAADTTNLPPGWIFDNAQGYIYGFGDGTERFCLGDECVLDATNFNGDPNTEYYWEGSAYPGEINYTVTEPGVYNLFVQFFEGCYVRGDIEAIEEYPPIAEIDPGPFCEGDPITVTVSPAGDIYKYQWYTGEENDTIFADLYWNDSSIYVKVTDTTNTCSALSNQTLQIKPSPKPEDVLGEDIWLKFGETVTLDAGEGTFYKWTSTPEKPISPDDQQYITVPGYIDEIEYAVYVELDGCPADGFKIVNMHPPSKLKVPTAFSPNGDLVNDELLIFGSGFSELNFRLYNRYGKMVFQTHDKSIGWNGNYNGAKQEADVYTYYVTVKYQDGGVYEQSGNVTLLR